MDEVIKRVEGLLTRKAEWLKERQNVVVDQDDLRELLLLAGRSREMRGSDERWEVRPCKDHLGNGTSYDICLSAEPGASGVAVVASIYSGEAVAQQIADAHNEALDRIKDQSHDD